MAEICHHSLIFYLNNFAVYPKKYYQMRWENFRNVLCSVMTMLMMMGRKLNKMENGLSIRGHLAVTTFFVYRSTKEIDDSQQYLHAKTSLSLSRKNQILDKHANFTVNASCMINEIGVCLSLWRLFVLNFVDYYISGCDKNRECCKCFLSL